MTNWNSFRSTGARVTTWSYDAYRGLLAGKTYHNGQSGGPSYGYTAGGRLASRTWARGTWTLFRDEGGAGKASSQPFESNQVP
jgi:hypothetical protein